MYPDRMCHKTAEVCRLVILLQRVLAVMSLALPLYGRESPHLLGHDVTVKVFGDVVKETVCQKAVCFYSGFCSLTSMCCAPLTLACCNHI
jgi:hypothetical protein